jgi:hypothetical protein
MARNDELSTGNQDDDHWWERPTPEDEWTPRPGDADYDLARAKLETRLDQARMLLRQPENRATLARFMLRKAKTPKQKLLKLAVGLAIATFMLPPE